MALAVKAISWRIFEKPMSQAHLRDLTRTQLWVEIALPHSAPNAAFLCEVCILRGWITGELLRRVCSFIEVKL
jgi:hypothetical protein